MGNLISAAWLKNMKNEENLVIFDCRFNLMDSGYGKKAYEEGHIKNAILINLDNDLAGDRDIHGGRHPLPDMSKFEEFMENFGVSNDTTVVIYDDGDLAGPARLWWMLKYMGLDNIYILEGGIKGWKENGGEITTEVNETFHKGKIVLNIRENMECGMEYVKSNINKKHVVVVDSRARERYLGIVEPMDKKAGHIPGAKNYDWTLNFTNGNILEISKLKEKFKDLERYSEVIVHCGSGITGCVNVLMLQEAGINSKLYVGSWSDWSSYDENPVSTIEE